ncbi:RNA binding protein, heterogenous nuclear RNP-K like protein [Linnemannia hyalina]|uniref:RNA binding protein, heterogenous nuclear RNP-K like protein n=1 Tax=Linnemannia hyalina TaxID=64524 RepID=A0A9P8BVU4_9FUNG|nr:RNA binding protein, heterogenous nuclear RNP-K like protein [Linnemannia hyalina]
MSLAKDSNDLAASASNNSLYEAQYDHDLDHKEGEAPDADAPLTLRALVSTKEAGVIIGKAGKNVADLRDQTGVKAGVSKVVQGVHDRVLTVSGSIEGVAKAWVGNSNGDNNDSSARTRTSWTLTAETGLILGAILIVHAFSLIAQNLLDNPITSSPPGTPANTIRPAVQTSSVRLLISHNLMGTIIGRQGLKIKHIQDTSSARMVASKEMLPQSTERVVEVQGSIDAIRIAIYEIGKCLVDDWERGVGTVLYNPSAPRVPGAGPAYTAGAPAAGARTNSNSNSNNNYTSRTGNGSDFTRPQDDATQYRPRPEPAFGQNNANLRTQEISIPADMVGCIIGKGGSKISEIRRLSGSRISIAKTPHDDSGERMFTIVGTLEANEKALYLLYGQLEAEKDKRLNLSGDHIEEDEE